MSMTNCPRLHELPSRPPGIAGWPWTEETPELPAVPNNARPQPAITVVTPSLNQGPFLEKTIRSVLLQAYPSLEYIIMDGGSTDGSVDTITKYQPWLTSWVSEKDNGQSYAINKGFERATGTILAWLNGDDIYLPGALAKVAEHAMRHPGACAFVGGGRRVDINGNVVRENVPDDVSFEGILNNRSRIPQASCFFTKKVFDAVGGVDESLFIPFDLDLWLKIAKKGRFVKIPGVLSQDLEHPDAKCMAEKHRHRHIAEKIIVLARYDEKLAQQEILELLRFYKEISSLPFYKPLRALYHKLMRK